MKNPALSDVQDYILDMTHLYPKDMRRIMSPIINRVCYNWYRHARIDKTIPLTDDGRCRLHNQLSAALKDIKNITLRV